MKEQNNEQNNGADSSMGTVSAVKRNNAGTCHVWYMYMYVHMYVKLHVYLYRNWKKRKLLWGLDIGRRVVVLSLYCRLEDDRVAVPPLKESCVLRQGFKFTLMILFYLLIYNNSRIGAPNT